MIKVTFSSVRLRKAEEPDDQGQRIDLQLNASANFSDISKQCSTNFFQHQRGLQRPEVLCLALPILGRILCASTFKNNAFPYSECIAIC